MIDNYNDFKLFLDKKIKNLYINVLEQNRDAMNLYYKNGFENFERKLKLGEKSANT